MATPSVTDVEQSESTTAIPLATAKRPANMRWKATAYSLAGAVSLLVIWQLASGYRPSEFDLLPAPLHVLERSFVGHELLDLVLCEIADAQFAAANECTAHGLKLAGEQPRQGRLAVTVAPD